MVYFGQNVRWNHPGEIDMSADTAATAEWLDARYAAKLLGVPGARNVKRLVDEGLIKTRDLPGVRAKYLRADVERLAGAGK